MSMTDEDFLAEILAHPDDLAARLVYADWLSERGEWRGEFIQVQCAIEAGDVSGAALRRLKERETALLYRALIEWNRANKLPVRQLDFRRGFLDSAQMSVRDFLKHGSKVFQQAPLRTISLTAGGKLMPRLLECESLAKLSGLVLRQNEFSDDDLAQLLRSPHLSQLQYLRLQKHSFGNSAVRAFAESPHLGNLTRFEIQNVDVEPGVLEGIITTNSVPALKHLVLCNCRLSFHEEELIAFAKPDGMNARLESLDLSENHFSELAARHLAKSPPFENLTTLNLRWNRLRDAGIKALFSSFSFPRLSSLNLTSNTLGRAGHIIAESPLLNQLERLYLTSNRINAAGVEAMLSSPHWNGKTQIAVQKNSLSEPEIADLKQRFGKSFGSI